MPTEPPDAKPQYVSQIISRIQQGDIKLPAFQRGFVWKPDQVLELFDSMLRGYPVGSVLLWRTDSRLESARDLGDFVLPETPEKYPTNYVLDGQQRLTSLFAVTTFSGPSDQENIFNVAYDLETEQFLHPAGETRATWMPLGVVSQVSRYLAFTKQLDEIKPELVARAQETYDSIYHYAIPVVTILGPAIEDVATIFERINSTGTKLTLFDLMVAATWAEDFLLRDAFDGISEELKQKKFEGISPVALLQVLAADLEGSAKRQSVLALRKYDADTLRTAIGKLEESTRRAVDLMATDFLVASSDFLPYERQFVALAHAFQKVPKVDAKAVSVMRRWFWRTAFAERYRRGGEGLLDEDLAALLGALKSGNVDSFGRPPDPTLFLSATFRKGTALAAGYAAFLANKRPLNLLKGDAVDVGVALSAFNRKEFHHIFPQAFLAKQKVTKPDASCLANICLLASAQNKEIGNSAPSVYFADLREVHGEAAFARILESNLIPPDARAAAEKDDYAGFAIARANLIAETVTKAI